MGHSAFLGGNDYQRHHPWLGKELGCPAPGRRRCTDPFCTMCFVVFLFGMWSVFHHALREGDLAKLTHGFDWRGSICGVDQAVLRLNSRLHVAGRRLRISVPQRGHPELELLLDSSSGWWGRSSEARRNLEHPGA
eukprot:Skav223748  [mRNA]  locus=scaffold3575:204602:207768:- [translate_table: standard]